MALSTSSQERVFGAEDHHFVLDISALEARRVSISVPPSFTGQVWITGGRKNTKIHASKGFSRRLKNGHVRVVRSSRVMQMPPTGDEEEQDTLCISTTGDVFVRLTGEAEGKQLRVAGMMSLTRLQKRFWYASR